MRRIRRRRRRRRREEEEEEEEEEEQAEEGTVDWSGERDDRDCRPLICSRLNHSINHLPTYT